MPKPLQKHCLGVLALLMVVLSASWFMLASWAGSVTRMEALTLNAEGALQARVSQPTKATVFYRTLGNRYQVIWDFESTQATPALLANTDWTTVFKRQWPTLVSATVQAFSGPVVRVRLEWALPQSVASESLGEPLMGHYQSQTPTLNLSRALLGSTMTSAINTTTNSQPVAASPPRYTTFSLPAVASPAATATASHTALQERIQQLEAERDAWQRKAEQQAQLQRTTADYTKLKEALETSKAALAKAIATINKQNETLQGLKAQVGELRTGLDSSTLDQQTYLNEELTKAEQEQKALQQKLADAERENAALKLVVDGLKKQQAALEEKQSNRLSAAEALPTQEGWKKSGVK